MKRENSFISNFRIISGIIIFFISIFFICQFYGEKYSQAKSKNVVNWHNQTRFKEFYELPKNSLDLVFIGSSHSYCSFDPINFDEALGISSYQMGTPLQHPDTGYFTLKEVVKTQKPKVAVFEIYWDMLDDAYEIKQAETFFEGVQNKEIEKEYIKEVFPINEKVKNAVPAIKYQADYFAFKSSEMVKEIEEKYKVFVRKAEDKNEEQNKDRYSTKGYIASEAQMAEGEYLETNQYLNHDGALYEIHNNQRAYLDKMLAICKENDITPIFVTAPVANVSMQYIKNYEVIHKEIADYAQKNNVRYIDYNLINEAEGILENTDFRDDAHLNDSGSKKFNSHFIENVLLKEGFF